MIFILNCRDTDYSSQPLDIDYSSQPLDTDYSSQPLDIDSSSQPLDTDFSSQPLDIDYETKMLASKIKKGQATYIAPLQPHTLAAFRPWGSSEGAGRI
jgi:hypothetical protein